MNILLRPILLLFLLSPASAQTRLQPPRLTASAPAADFGEVRAGKVLTHTFRLENRGERLLEIRRIQTSCGCTASEITTREIPAGGHALLTASLDLTGRSGPQTEHIRVHSNDPLSPVTQLTLTAHAVPRVSITPQTLNFQSIRPEEPPVGQVVIRATTDTPLEITGIRALHGLVSTGLEEVEPGRTFHVRIQPSATDLSGHQSDRVEIQTNDPERPVLPVLVMWQIAEAVSVAPRQLNLLLSDPPQPVTRFLLVRSQANLDPPLEITSVIWEGRDVDMNIGAAASFGTRVEFSITPEAAMDGEKIHIHTNVPGFEHLTLPVRILTP